MRNFSKKRCAALLAIFTVGLFPTAFAQTSTQTNPFSDVSATSINADAIDYLKDQGVLQGYPDGTYRPSTDINRAEFIKIIVGSLKKDLKGKNCFPDVKDEWFAPYVCEAKSLGIVQGYPDGNFKPDEKINFSEASKIIVNAYGVSKGESGDLWFKPYVSGLEARKDIPLSVNFFNENLKRDAMAEMVYRLKADVKDKPTRTYREIVGDDFVTVDSCVDLQKRFNEMNAYTMGEGYGAGAGAVDGVLREEAMPLKSAEAPMAAPQPVAADSASVSNTSAGASQDFSTTNLQVAGVDEADVIKNDGKFIYIIKSNTLRIVEAYPANNLKELVSFTLGDENENFTPSEMYVDGNQLTVIGSTYRTYPEVTPAAETSTTTTTEKIAAPSSMIYPPYYGSSRTKVFVVDMTDRTKPSVKRAVEFDGYYNTSRKIDGNLYMVMNFSYYPPVIYYDAPMARTAPAASADLIVPHMLDTKKGAEEAVAPCSKIRILPKENNFNFLIAAAVPLNDLTKDVSRSVIVGNSENVYVSQHNLYVAANDWGGGYYRSYNDYGTSVYRFELNNGTIEYKNKGKVPGQLLNQFSMDESNGYFRVATTKNEYTPGSQINNNVYVLDMKMQLTGKIENIAPGEKLYSARFMGDKAYLVTFKRVDPFFVLDLKDPKAPKITGKLKVPGFSDYLQPYDENHIIGFGYDVDASKVDEDADFLPYDAKKGLKISMFDVTDVANPREMFKEVIGTTGTMSDVLYNHKALLLDKEKQLMALPVTVYENEPQEACTSYTYSTCPTSCQKVCVPTSCTTENGIKVCTADCDGANSCTQVPTTYGKPVFDGAYVYTVNLNDGFKLRGKVSHYSQADMDSLETNGYTNYEKTIQRILYIGESLYTVSQGAVKANVLSTLSEQKMIELAGSIYQIYYGKPMPL
ncbi:MAG: beta-propeller domain-containing protein [Candidatus Gracilibacteria bacterium]